MTPPVIERLDDVRMDEVRLRTPVGDADLAALKLGDVVYLDGILYTAREGVYRRVVDRCPQPHLVHADVVQPLDDRRRHSIPSRR